MDTQQIVNNLPIVPGGVHWGPKPDVNTCLIESNLVNQCNRAFKNSPPRLLCKTLGKPNNRKTSLSRALAAVVDVLSGNGIAHK